MAIKWQSTGIYQHPVKHQAGTYGTVVQHETGIYSLNVGGSHMSCPPEWAAKIHHDEIEAARKIQYQLYIPQEMKARLEAESEKTGAPIAEIVRRAVEKYLQ
jgi:hypothetical protein